MDAPAVVLFDLDGTLTDPQVGITLSLQAALASVGVAVDDPAPLRSHIGPPILDVFASFGVTGEAATLALATYRERYDRIGAFENFVFPGIPELLDALVADGRRLAVATSKPEWLARVILEHFDLADRFTVIAGASRDQSRSTKADVVARALLLLDEPDPATAVLVGDRRHDVDGARAHGVACIAVTWGFAEPDELAAAGPQQVVDAVEALALALGLPA